LYPCFDHSFTINLYSWGFYEPNNLNFLQLIYIDALIKFKALVLHEGLTLPEGEPWIHFIGTEHLAFLAAADVKSRSKDHTEYGLLQASSIIIFWKGL
jgi:hypothetical protein